MGSPEQVQQMREILSGTGLPLADVWVSYYGMGGSVSQFELEAYLGGLLVLDDQERDVLADATNDLLVARGAKERVSSGVAHSSTESTRSRYELGQAGAFLLTADEREQERLHAVTRTALLDTDREARFDQITQEAKDYFGVSSSIVALIDDRRQFLKSVIGPVQQNMPREISFCNATIRNAGPLIVRDALQDDRFRENPLVTGEPYIRFYAGYPLRGPGGWTIGTLCVIDQMPRKYTMSDDDALRALARRAENQINGSPVYSDEDAEPTGSPEEEPEPKQKPSL